MVYTQRTSHELRAFMEKLDKDIDINDYIEIQKLADIFLAWNKYNKGYDIDIDIFMSNKFDIVIAVHDLFYEIRICDGYELLEDIKELLYDYATNEEKLKYMIDFWEELL